MRDTHDDMIELVNIEKLNDLNSSIILHKINGELLRLKFGILPDDFSRLRKILEFRPYENKGFAPYRYFFALSSHNDPENKNLAFISVRVEQLDRHKQYEFLVSKTFISNLLRFNQLTGKEEVENLIVK